MARDNIPTVEECAKWYLEHFGDRPEAEQEAALGALIWATGHFEGDLYKAIDETAK
jgi:hypothetical protein